MAAAEVLTPSDAVCVYLQIALPGRGVENAGVLLLDPANDEAHIRFRRDWRQLADDEDAEFFEYIEDDLRAKARQWGGVRLLEYLEDTLSNALRITAREAMKVANFEGRLNRLYRQNVQPTIARFVTHLPQFSFQAAAGSFGDDMLVETEDWVEVPPDIRLTEDMFVGHVVGHSMEPKIPAGSLCVFRRNVTGSRSGKLLLIENFGLGENQGRYTIKRYKSEKVVTEDGWHHRRIRLEPLNPEYEPWELDEGDFKVLAEFVRVLPPEE